MGSEPNTRYKSLDAGYVTPQLGQFVLNRIVRVEYNNTDTGPTIGTRVGREWQVLQPLGLRLQDGGHR